MATAARPINSPTHADGHGHTPGPTSDTPGPTSHSPVSGLTSGQRAHVRSAGHVRPHGLRPAPTGPPRGNAVYGDSHTATRPTTGYTDGQNPTARDNGLARSPAHSDGRSRRCGNAVYGHGHASGHGDGHAWAARYHRWESGEKDFVSRHPSYAFPRRGNAVYGHGHTRTSATLANGPATSARWGAAQPRQRPRPHRASNARPSLLPAMTTAARAPR